MRFERFVTRRFLPRERNSFSTPLVDIAVCSIALGVLVMVMAVSILLGFQNEIKDKVVGFGSHIVVTGIEQNDGYMATPIERDRPVFAVLESHNGVEHIQFYAEKGGMVKTAESIHGMILKGVDANYDTTFFASNLVKGRMFSLADTVPSNEVIVSQSIASKLCLGIGDKLPTYFWQDNNYRARAFTIAGIYNTDMMEFDDHYVLGDLRQVQRLNNWNPNLVEGCEIKLRDFGRLPSTAQEIYNQLDYDLNLTTITEQQPSLFAWLRLLDSNIVLILTVMAVVCVVAIVSSLLIMIFEKTQTIGILKTMGCRDSSIRKIFMLKAATIIMKGVVIGDAVALLLSALQTRFHLVSLDSESYSMSFVPVYINGWHYVAISVGTVAVCLAALLIPATTIAKVQPAKTIRVE